MRRSPAIGVVALAAALGCGVCLGGCHLVFPYGRRGDAAGDGAPGDAHRERAARDLRGERPVDGWRAELGPCVDETPAAPPAVAACTIGCAGPLDCDGMPNAPPGRDPYPGECNRMTVPEVTFAEPASEWLIYNAKWSRDCGWLKLDPGAGVGWAVRTGSLPPNTLVETRVRLQAIGNQDAWSVGIVGRLAWNAGPTAFITCELTRDINSGANNPILIPDLRVNLKSGNNETGGWPMPNTAADAKRNTTVGATYTLQLWYTPDVNKVIANVTPKCSGSCPAVVCRMCNAIQCWGGFYAAYPAAGGDPQAIPAQGGAVAFYTMGRAADFDYVRVYELSNP